MWGCGLTGYYFDNLNLSGRPSRSRVDAGIDFDWTTNGSKEAVDLTPGFSARWTGVLVAPESGRYQLGFAVRDGVRLWVDGKLIVDEWASSGKRTVGAGIELERGRKYGVVVEYFKASDVRAADAPAAPVAAAAGALGTTGARRGKPVRGSGGGAMADQDGNVVSAPPTATPVVSSAVSQSLVVVKPTSEARATSSRDDAVVQLRWTRPSTEPFYAEAVRAAERADAVVMVLGITADLEREESLVHFQGFEGGDRTSLDLPAVQEELLEKVMEAAKGKPVTLVLTNGSALSVNWADAHVPSIVEAWYPGQRGGDAVADVVFGKFNPAGRLPVTFYKSVADLPAFDDYRMKGRTYRYFAGKALYPFGYGLSYTTFSYSGLTALSDHATTGGNFNVSVKVKNSGAVAGDEVVQMYLSHDGAAETVPAKALVGFKRVSLAPGEEKRVEFTVTPLQMAVVDEGGKRVVKAGGVTLRVGPNSEEGETLRVKVEGETVEPGFGFVAPVVK